MQSFRGAGAGIGGRGVRRELSPQFEKGGGVKLCFWPLFGKYLKKSWILIIEAKSQRYKGTLWTRITFLSIFFLPAPETATFGVKIEKKLNFDHRRKKLSINQKVYGYFEAQWHFCLLCLSVRKACLLPLFSPLTKFAPSPHPKLSIPLTKLVNLYPSFRSHHKASSLQKEKKSKSDSPLQPLSCYCWRYWWHISLKMSHFR